MSNEALKKIREHGASVILRRLFHSPAKPHASPARHDGASPAQPNTLPLLGRLPLELQLRILAVTFVISVLLGIAAAYTQSRNASRGAAYAAIVTELRPLAERIANAGMISLRGQAAGFREMALARAQFSQRLTVLSRGGEIDGVRVFATRGEAQPALDALQKTWALEDRLLTQLAAQENTLLLLAELANIGGRQGPAMLADADAAGGALPRLTGRILYGVARLTLLPEISLPDLLQLVNDIAIAHALAPRGGALADGLAALEKHFAALPADIRPLSALRVAGGVTNNDALIAAVDALAAAYAAEFATPPLFTALAVATGSLALVALVLMIMLFNQDSTQRRMAAERQQRIARTEQEAAEQAILRLRNEMSDLANGDLTVHATVADDITGPIADAMNYAIEELAVLVHRLNHAAERVTHTTDIAQAISRELLDATENQAHEIRGAGARVQATANSMHKVSTAAQESVDVAHLSVEVARQGARAVTDSIASMQVIRGQIQETAKRIKRLGESSQEIGEIVDLITDITEQTNVLALNATIQAASAGEAGRGFSVVAEEVQRLAERSAAATRQIATLVRAIQSDTHDAVAAMERSTQNVVAGAGLADTAGQALTEISRVSEDLAQRVATIAGATQAQAGNAAQVAEAMRRILDITGQTTRRTQDTAQAVSDLAELAIDLKASVANFKL
jgi:twitching motility protein PilJ